jgi:hypothetical protein
LCFLGWNVTVIPFWYTASDQETHVELEVFPSPLTPRGRGISHGYRRIVQRLKDEGRQEGSRSRGQTDLLTIYRARFGSVPRKIRAAIERTRDDAALTKWVEIFVTRSAAEIATAVTKK